MNKTKLQVRTLRVCLRNIDSRRNKIQLTFMYLESCYIAKFAQKQMPEDSRNDSECRQQRKT